MSDRNAPYTRYYNVNRLSPGRAALVARQLLRLARQFGEAILVDLAARLLESADSYGRIGHHRRSQSGRRGEGSAYKIDKKVDRNVKGYAEQLDTVIADYGEEHRLGKAAIELRDATVPKGHYAVTGLPYEDEAQAVERIVDHMRAVDRATLERMNVLYYLERLEGLLPEYFAALEVRRIVTAGDVKSAREQMHRDLCNVVGYICARFSRAQDVETRDELLAPIDDQQDRISALARARRLGGTAAAASQDAANAEDAALDALLDEELAFDEGAEAAELGGAAGGDAAGGGPDALDRGGDGLDGDRIEDAEPVSAAPAGAEPAEVEPDGAGQGDEVNRA